MNVNLFQSILIYTFALFTLIFNHFYLVHHQFTIQIEPNGTPILHWVGKLYLRFILIKSFYRSQEVDTQKKIDYKQQLGISALWKIKAKKVDTVMKSILHYYKFLKSRELRQFDYAREQKR